MGLLVGCGSGTNTFSCDKGSGTSRVCIDYDAVSGDANAVKATCTTVGTTCVRTGTVGGCKITAPAGESGSYTVWYFSGTSASVMQTCGSSGTYVAP